MSAGVLNRQEIEKIFLKTNSSLLHHSSSVAHEIGASSIDLPLGSNYWEMSASCRPSREVSLSDLLRVHKKSDSQRLVDGTVFDVDKVYWVELAYDEVELPSDICARATAKSSVGRLDAMVRLLADRHDEFDKIDLGRRAKLLLEVVPLTFPLVVRPGMALSQLRFIRGREELCTVRAEALALESEPVLVEEDCKRKMFTPLEDDPYGVLLTLNLDNDPSLGFAGFRAKREVRSAIDPALKGKLDPREYWDGVVASSRGTVTIEKDQFYIFRSKERFRIPGTMAVDCRAYSETLGDIRIHYAGFAHPWFGYVRDEHGSNDGRGTPLIFEVRGFSMDTILRDGSPLAKVYFRRMATPIAEEFGSYSDQELKLSNCFSEWIVPK